jgi:5-methylcytosine-specific restriction endonuclease McrA
MMVLGKVEVVKDYGSLLRAQSWRVSMPAVVRLRKYVRRRRIRVALSRRNVFYRDGQQCQYCLRRLPLRDLTCDHVNPKSQGGPTTWENVVAACAPCNRVKGGRTPEQARMKLRKRPLPPKTLPVELTLNLHGRAPDIWQDFLGWTMAVEAKAS